MPKVERFWVYYIADTGSYHVCQELKSFGYPTLQIQARTKLPRVEKFWVSYIADTGWYQVCQELKSFGFPTLQIQAGTKFAKS